MKRKKKIYGSKQDASSAITTHKIILVLLIGLRIACTSRRGPMRLFGLVIAVHTALSLLFAGVFPKAISLIRRKLNVFLSL